MAEDFATCRHVPPTRQRMVAAADEKSRTWRGLRDWLLPRFLPAYRSGDDKPNGGVVGHNGAVIRKVHWRVFPAMKRSDSSGGVLELSGTKVVVAGIRQPLGGLAELRTRRSPNPNLLWL